MPCPHIHLSDYSTPAVRVYLCQNPIRGGDVAAPSLGYLREHCLADSRYEKCLGYREALEKNTDPPRHGDLLWNL